MPDTRQRLWRCVLRDELDLMLSVAPSDEPPALFELEAVGETLQVFRQGAREILSSASLDLPGQASVTLGDSRDASRSLAKADLVLTSPPYVNRMSYIRELRPYMYWLRYLDSGSDAGALDWQAIGGTWGSATSKLNSWEPSGATPIEDDLRAVTSLIRRDGAKNGPLLATYVTKYHHDMWAHFQEMTSQLAPRARLSYIIGNSTFYGHEVPVPRWFAQMLSALGFQQVAISVIRKRNSNKALFEYEVTGQRP